MENRGMPLIGDKFPEMTVQTTHGEIKLPEAFKGQWFILFSHPADFTPVCTTEFYAFQQRYAEFKELNTELIGLSVDQVYSHIKWTEWIDENLDAHIDFPIIADTGAVADTLGLIHPGSGTHTVRAVFFVDPKSTVRAILYYPAELGRNFDEFLRMIKGFQMADKEGRRDPGQLAEKRTLRRRCHPPPASNVKDAEARKDKEGCLDWWLCHKKV